MPTSKSKSSLSEAVAFAQFLAQKRQRKEQKSAAADAPKSRSVPVKGYGGGGKRYSSVNKEPRRRRLAFIGKTPSRGGTKGASKQVTAQQKINYMVKGLEAQEESAQRMRTAAINDMLDLQTRSAVEKASWPISEAQASMNELMKMMVAQSKGNSLGGDSLGGLQYVDLVGQSDPKEMDILR